MGLRAELEGSGIQIEEDGGIVSICLMCPEKRNRLTMDSLAAFEVVFDMIEGRRDVSVVILRAEGSTFCAGFDLVALGEGASNGSAVDIVNMFERVCGRLEKLRPITIAAISGGAYGGGSDLALACDFRIGVPEVKIHVPVGRFGIQFYASGLRRFISRTNVGLAKSVFLAGEHICADRLLAAGYLDELTTLNELQSRTKNLAEQIEALAPSAVQGMKRSINEISINQIDFEKSSVRSMMSLLSIERKDNILQNK